MKSRYIYIIGSRVCMMLAVLWLLACTSDGVDQQQLSPLDGKVAVELILCVFPSQPSITRQAADIEQNGQNLDAYRGIEKICLVPFATQGEIQKGDKPMLQSIVTAPIQQTNTTNYLKKDVDLLIGTASFLAYAQALPLSNEPTKTTPDYKFKYGKLTESTAFTNRSFITPEDISFQLERIKTTEGADAKATALATYLTSIARAEGWSTSTNDALKNLYESFTADGVRAGSSANVQAMVTKLNKELGTSYTGTDATVVSNIRTAIQGSGTSTATIKENQSVTLTGTLAGYPANINLPDGSAAIKWNSVLKQKEGAEEGVMEEDKERSGFIALTTAENGLDMNDQSRYAYPADLYYFANSRIRTSTVSQASHYTEVGSTNGDAGTKNNWNHVLSFYGTEDAVIASTTRSVALTDMLDYAVSCLELQIKADGILEGGKHYLNEGSQATENRICLEDNATSFPLTGVFVGGQFPVGFNFEPDDGTTSEDTEHERIIYDNEVVSGIYLNTSLTAANYTLALQSKINKPVNIVLEFANNSNKEFIGYEGGIIYPGTHFYLSGKIIPALEGEDRFQRVFKRDHKTKLVITVKSLANAYNVIPDLKSAQHDLEVTSIVVQQWSDKTTANQNIFNW